MQAATEVQEKRRSVKAPARPASKASNPPAIQPAPAKQHPVYGSAANAKGFSLSKQSLPTLNDWHKRATDSALSFGDSKLTKSQEELFDLYDHAAWDIHIAAEKVEARNSREVWHKVDLLARQARYLGGDDCNVSASVMTKIAGELERYTVPRPPSLPDRSLSASRATDVELWQLHDKFCVEHGKLMALDNADTEAGDPAHKHATPSQRRSFRNWEKQLYRTDAAAMKVVRARASSIDGMLTKMNVVGFLIGPAKGTFSVVTKSGRRRWKLPYTPKTPELKLILSLRDDLRRFCEKGVA